MSSTFRRAHEDAPSLAGGRQRGCLVTTAQRLDTALEGCAAETPAINGAVLNLHNLHNGEDEWRSEGTGMRDDSRDAKHSTMMMMITTQVVQSQRGCSVQLLQFRASTQPPQPTQPFTEEVMSKERDNRDTRVQRSFRSGCARCVGCAYRAYRPGCLPLMRTQPRGSRARDVVQIQETKPEATTRSAGTGRPAPLSPLREARR